MPLHRLVAIPVAATLFAVGLAPAARADAPPLHVVEAIDATIKKASAKHRALKDKYGNGRGSAELTCDAPSSARPYRTTCVATSTWKPNGKRTQRRTWRYVVTKKRSTGVVRARLVR